MSMTPERMMNPAGESQPPISRARSMSPMRAQSPSRNDASLMSPRREMLLGGMPSIKPSIGPKTQSKVKQAKTTKAAKVTKTAEGKPSRVTRSKDGTLPKAIELYGPTDYAFPAATGARVVKTTVKAAPRSQEKKSAAAAGVEKETKPTEVKASTITGISQVSPSAKTKAKCKKDKQRPVAKSKSKDKTQTGKIKVETTAKHNPKVKTGAGVKKTKAKAKAKKKKTIK